MAAEGPRKSLRAALHSRSNRRLVLGVLTLFVAGLMLMGPARLLADEISFFRIGTGSAIGTYFPVGGLIASAISNPPGSRACQRGGSCGVPGMIAVAQSTEGSVANVEGIGAGLLESGFSQADVAYWAYTGSGIYKDKGPIEDLRVIANLFPESVHLVARKGTGIRQVSDLRGKRVSLDRPASGTRVDALLILEVYGLTPKDLEVVGVSVGQAVDMMRAGELDAFFMVVGTPAKAIRDLSQEQEIIMVPIDGEPAARLQETYPFFAPDRIESGVYHNIPLTHTLSVGAQWLVSSKISDEMVYAMTKALWHENTRALLDNGHPKGRLISLETARDGLGIPLHPGAERFYDEVGQKSAD